VRNVHAAGFARRMLPLGVLLGTLLASTISRAQRDAGTASDATPPPSPSAAAPGAPAAAPEAQAQPSAEAQTATEDVTPPAPAPADPASAPVAAAPLAGSASVSHAAGPPSPWLKVSGSFDPLLDLRQRFLVGRSNGADAALAKRTQATGYLFLSAQATELGAQYGVRGLSLHLNGWLANEEAEVVLDKRRTGDLTHGYVQYQGRQVELRLGRQFAYAAGSIPAQIDGLQARVGLPAGFGVQAFGGLSVLPRFSGNPRYYLLGNRIDDLVKSDVRALLDAQERTRSLDFWSAGGRLSHRYRQHTQVGLGFVEERERSYLARRTLTFDAAWEPHSKLDLLAAAEVDTTSWRPQVMRLRADVYPLADLQLSPGYAFSDPTLFLSRYSIFSVFANEANHDVGLDASYRLLRRVQLVAGYHQQLLVGSKGSNADYKGDGLRLGATASGRVDLRLGPRDELRTGVEYRFLTRAGNGYHGLRGFGAFQLTPRTLAALDLSLYLYEKAISRYYAPDGSGGRRSVDASLSLAHEGRSWRVAASAGAMATPLIDTALYAMLTASYRLEVGGPTQGFSP
jgi:hypothetical protein